MHYPATFEVPTTDMLTGLLNAQYFRYLLREDLLPRAERDGWVLSLLYIDLDGFAEINATAGKRCGDHVLVHVARLLQQTFPADALLARQGGDEFAVALPGTRLDDAFTMAEEFRRRVMAHTLAEWPAVRLTCTIGISSFPANGKHLWKLAREADQALYVAKSTGRNKVALPLAEGRMITKTSYYTATQLERLAHLAKAIGLNEADLLREGLDDVLKKYNDLRSAPPQEDAGPEAATTPR